MTRKERKLRKLIERILNWSWSDQYVQELIEVAHRIEGRRLAEAIELGLSGKKARDDLGMKSE